MGYIVNLTELSVKEEMKLTMPGRLISNSDKAAMYSTGGGVA